MENAYIMSRLKASMKHADRIITISEFSRQEIDSMCPGSGSRVKVIYNGLNRMENSGGNCALSPDGPYIYATASGLPHKNAAGVLKTYDMYFHQAAEPARLVVVGIPGTEGYEISEEAAACVTCYKYIERTEDMHSLLAGARAFLFLSLIEGFGFPPLEAMQLGVPVVCSDRTALTEVVSDAGLLTDPENYEQTVECLNRVLEEEELRKSLVRKGYANVKRFDWDSRITAYWEELSR